MTLKIIIGLSLHSGGGLTYLYFLQKFLDQEKNILILDSRTKNQISFKKSKVFFLNKGLFRNIKIFVIRSFYYLNYLVKCNQKEKNFLEIYLNGIPPFIRFPNIKTYIFCQNRLVFQSISWKNIFSLNLIKSEMIVLINKFLIKIFLRSQDTIIVQTPTMKRIVKEEINNKIILQKYIWGDFDLKALKRIKENMRVNKKISIFLKKLNSNNIIFFYPAAFYKHKNHVNLLKAFDFLKNKNIKNYKLILTLNESNLINDIQSNKNIVFLENVQYHEILEIYNYVDYLVFPSFLESYGLPLIEARLNKIKIIASNLQYVYDVCQPDFVFNPNKPKEISNILHAILKR